MPDVRAQFASSHGRHIAATALIAHGGLGLGLAIHLPRPVGQDAIVAAVLALLVRATP